MRCKQCGWENPAEATTCVKCHSSLKELPSNNRPVPPAENAGGTRREREQELRGTVRETDMASSRRKTQRHEEQSASMRETPTPSVGAADGDGQCPKCGYRVAAGSEACPNCGQELSTRLEPAGQGKPKNKALGGTVGVWDRPSESEYLTLQAMPWQGETAKYEPVAFTGDRVVLTRGNTDANNNTITSKEQAVLTKEDGKWYIENLSEQRSTLIRLTRKMELQDGDVIVLGNRSFEFRIK